MVDVTIIDSNNVTFTFQEGDVNNVRETITSEIDHLPMPLGGSAQAYAYDFSGVTKRINLSGQLTDAGSYNRVDSGTVTTIIQQKQYLESLQTGNQEHCTFTSNYASESSDTATGATTPYLSTFTSTLVYVEKVEFSEEEANPDMLKFTMDLIVAQ